MRILNVPYDVSCLVSACIVRAAVDDISHAVISAGVLGVLPLQLAGVSPYMKTILDAEGGYDQRMREKGLNPLCQLTSTL